MRAAQPVVAYDIARLFIGPLFSTPRGIDRVDLALARHVFDADDSPNLGVLPSFWGVRVYSARTVRRWLSQLQTHWAEDLDLHADRHLRQLIRTLHKAESGEAADNPSPNSQPALRFGKARQIIRIFGQFAAADAPLGAPVRSAVPQGAVYLNIGQLGLAVPAFHNWLADRPDVTSIMMLHDAIPIEAPQLVPSGAAAHHTRMIRTAARRAQCLIFNSNVTQSRVTETMQRLTQIKLPGMVRNLPLPKAFQDVSKSLSALSGIPYFVTVSTIEPRKNHALLWRVWDRLIQKLGRRAPHLIVVGSRGYAAETILAPLQSQPALRTRVHIVSGLSSPALAALVLGATGMLCPSLIEGFGMPVQEANALGIPTIASDIPAHREVGDCSTIFLPCADDAAWEAAILSAQGAPLRKRPAISSSLTEAAYASDILKFIQEFADHPNSREAAEH